MSSLVLQNVSKRFGDVLAVSDVSFHARSGRILGLLGPNGAGKTTIIRIITSILDQDGGRVQLLDRDVGPWSQEHIGYLPEERGLYKKLKVRSQLQYFADLKGVHRKDSTKLINYWLDRLDLLKWGTRKAQDLSKGMQQKVQFIAAIPTNDLEFSRSSISGTFSANLTDFPCFIGAIPATSGHFQILFSVFSDAWTHLPHWVRKPFFPLLTSFCYSGEFKMNPAVYCP